MRIWGGWAGHPVLPSPVCPAGNTEYHRVHTEAPRDRIKCQIQISKKMLNVKRRGMVHLRCDMPCPVPLPPRTLKNKYQNSNANINCPLFRRGEWRFAPFILLPPKTPKFKFQTINYNINILCNEGLQGRTGVSARFIE
ncbi:MAG: hypothetical protein D6732_19960 [Methanobacteriota archaeon]|nr:MAG: hypothetical protein D6732_19960 [Euryarchaeota archaeon]